MAAICSRDDYLKERVSPENAHIYVGFSSSLEYDLADCSAFLYLVARIRERTTPVPQTLEINPLRVVESYGLSNGGRIKPVGFVLSGRVSDF